MAFPEISVFDPKAITPFLPPESRFREHMERLSEEPHVAGSAANAGIGSFIGHFMESCGLDVEYSPYDVLLSVPREESSFVEIVVPFRKRLMDKEDAPEGRKDVFSRCTKGFNAFSANGDAIAPVIYANYGRKEDFDRLSSMGIDLRGKIILARYGKIFRGKIATNAQRAGAIGVLFYSDPADYESPGESPSHGMRSCAIQRGGILDLPYPGDPLTPGVPAWPGESGKTAARIDADQVKFHEIMAAPLSWDSAKEILSRMDGSSAPDEWAGGLNLPYRLGDSGDLRVRMAVHQDRVMSRITNVIGSLTGSEFPDQAIIIGSHFDAWAFGSADPVSGTAMLLIIAETLGNMKSAGFMFSRTIRIAHWDAEEPGMMGSIEWLEEHASEIAGKVLAFINADGVVSGSTLELKSSPLLQGVMTAVAKAVPYDHARSFHEKWKEQETKNEFLPMGGGSDHIGFLYHHAIPSCLAALVNPTPVYHSLFDNMDWYAEHGDVSFLQGNRLARYLLALMLTLSENRVVPYSPEDLISYIEANINLLGIDRSGTGSLHQAVGRARDEWKTLKDEFSGSFADPDPIHGALMSMEKAFSRETADWNKSILYSIDPDTGYGERSLPEIVSALKECDDESVAEAVDALVKAIDRVTGSFRSIRQAEVFRSRGNS